MSFEGDLKNFAAADVALNALIGTRFYPGALPENPTYPAVTYFKIDGNRHHNIDVAFPRYQFSCWSPVYLTAQVTATAVRKAFQRYKGIMGSTQIIQGVYERQGDLYEPDTKLFHIPVDIKFIIREA